MDSACTDLSPHPGICFSLCYKPIFFRFVFLWSKKNSVIWQFGLVAVLLLIKTCYWCFPGGAVVESLPAGAGVTGSSPGLGGSHMPWSSWACVPQLLSLRVWSLCSATGEAAIVRGPRTAMRSGPRLPQLEKALARERRPSTAINKKKDRKSTRLNSSHITISYAVFCLKKKYV